MLQDAGSDKFYEEALWQSISSSLRTAYQKAEKAKKHGLPIIGLRVDDFVGLMSEQIYKLAVPSMRTHLNEAENFLKLKQTLYSVFRRIDYNADNLVSWDDITTYIMDEKRTTSHETEGAEALSKFIYKKTIRCTYRCTSRTMEGLEIQTVSDLERKVTSRRKAIAAAAAGFPVVNNEVVDSGDVDESYETINLQEPWVKVFSIQKWRKMISFSQYCDVRIHNVDMKILGVFPKYLSIPRCVHVFEDLVPVIAVIGYNDGFLRVFQLKDKRVKIDIHFENQIKLDTPITCIKQWSAHPTGLAVGNVEGGISYLQYVPQNSTQKTSLTIVRQREFHVKAAITDFLFLPKGHLVTCSTDKTIRIYEPDDTKDDKKPPVILGAETTGGHKSAIYCLEFSVKHQVICSAGYEYEPMLWNLLALDDPPLVLRDVSTPHKACLVTVKFLGDTPLLASCDTFGVVKVWDLRFASCLQTFSEHVAGFAKNTSGHEVISLIYFPHNNELVTYGKYITYFGETDRTDPNSCGDEPVISIEYHTPTHTILIAHSRSVSVWDANRGTRMCVHPCPYLPPFESVTAFALTPRGRIYFIGTSHGTVATHQMGEGVVLQLYEHFHMADITSLSYFEATTAHLEFILTTSLDGEMHIITDDARLPRKFTVGAGMSVTLGVHNDSHMLTALTTVCGKMIAIEPNTCVTRGAIAKVQYITSEQPITLHLANSRSALKGSKSVSIKEEVLPAVDTGGEEIISMCCVGRTPAIAVTDTTGYLRVMQMKQLNPVCEWRCPPRTKGTKKSNPILTCVDSMYAAGVQLLLYGGDDAGRLFIFDVMSVDAITSTRVRMDADLVPLHCMRQWEAHRTAITAVRGIPSLRLILTTAEDLTAHVWKVDGQKMGVLCVGRALRNVRWHSALNLDGSVPPYTFPPKPTNSNTSKGAMKRILQFFCVLRRKAQERRRRLHHTTALGAEEPQEEKEELAQSLRGGGYSIQEPKKGSPPERNASVYSPGGRTPAGAADNLLNVSSSPRVSMMLSSATLRQQSTTVLFDNSIPVATFLMKRKVELKVRLAKDIAANQQQQQQLESAERRLHLDIMKDYSKSRSTAVETALRAPPPGMISVADIGKTYVNPLETFESTEEKIDKHVGHLLTLSADGKGVTTECSTRLIVPTLSKKFKAQDLEHRQVAWEEKMIRKLQHSLSREDHKKMDQIVSVRTAREHKKQTLIEQQLSSSRNVTPTSGGHGAGFKILDLTKVHNNYTNEGVVLSSRTHMIPVRPQSARVHHTTSSATTDHKAPHPPVKPHTPRPQSAKSGWILHK
eukprot:PhF_6_TR27169/c0_g1_i1/m.39796